MPHWLIKSAIHRVISVLPQRQKWNELFQERVTKSLQLSQGAFDTKVEVSRRYLEEFLELHPEGVDGFTALEVGTGWYPTTPIVLYLCGAKEIWSFDIDPLLRQDRIRVLLDYFREAARTGKLHRLLPQLKKERLTDLEAAWQENEKGTPQGALKKLGITALTRDVQATGLPDKSIDLFFSYSVTEYIPAVVQANIYVEFRRLATPKGTIVQYISLKDQFAGFDSRLGPLNFLRYSSGTWKLLDSPLIPQTRLRISDYRNLLTAGGFKITKECSASAPLEELAKIPLAPEFKKYFPDDLRVINTWLIASLDNKAPGK